MRTKWLALIAPLAVLAGACGSTSSSSSSSAGSTATPSTPATTPSSPASTASGTTAAKATVALATRSLPGVGTVLVNGQGRTLYVFVPDAAKKVTCTGACAAVWPPLAIAAGHKPAVSGGVKASLVSSDPNPSGGSVVTYAGWPLYLYVADPKAGTDHGQGINSSGGLWYVIAPSGRVIKGASSSGGAGTSGSTTGGGGTSGGSPYNSGGAGY